MRFLIYQTKFLLALLALTAIINSFTFAQNKRGGAALKPKAEKPGGTLVSESSKLMSAAWEKGELPAALPIPAGNADEAITLLAKKIAAKNSESIPALLTAVQMSGFFVTDKTGKVVLTPADGKGQGLPVNGWEIASAAKMLGDGKQTTLAELETTLRSVPKLKRAEISRLIINGLKQNAANEKNPFLRNWARLIIELGKNSRGKYDLSASAAPDQITLDAVQNLLILRRIYGDFYTLAEKNKRGTPTVRSAVKPNSARFINASFSRSASDETEDSGFVEAEKLRAVSPSANVSAEAPCQLNGDAPLVLDAVATGLGFGFGELTGFLDGALDGTAAGDALGKYTAAAGIANIILTYAKFLQTYAALETKLTLEDAPPLVRTKNARPGERKKLKAEVRMNIGNWQMYNCLRTAINLAGIDFAVAVDGAVSGAGVTWHLDEGGAGDVYSNRGGLTGNEQIVGFTQDGGRIQEPGTSTGTDGARIGNATYTKTDGDGIARIILEGSPQKNAKVGKIMPVMKQAKISTTVKLKAGDLKSDSVDIAGQALGGITGLITLPLELLYRLDWVSTAFLDVPVKDWEECSGNGWIGTITYTRTQTATNNKTVKRVSKRGQDTTTWEMKDVYNAQISVSESPEEKGVSIGTAAISSSSNSSERTSSSEMNLCPGKREMQQMHGESATTTTVNGSAGNIRVSVGISTNSDGTYRISIITPQIKGMAGGSMSSSYSGQCRPKEGRNISSPPTEVSISGKNFGTEMQRVNPSEPNRLSGSYSKTWQNVTETLTWDLRKCGASFQSNNLRNETRNEFAFFDNQKSSAITRFYWNKDYLLEIFRAENSR